MSILDSSLLDPNPMAFSVSVTVYSAATVHT